LKLFETSLIVIGWRRRAFRKYFDSEDNFTEFHKEAHCLLESLTIAITVTCKLQERIEDWLEKAEGREGEGEGRAEVETAHSCLCQLRPWQRRGHGIAQRGKLTSRTVMPAAAQVPTSADDPLQRPVDPKLLVTSGARGPPARRQRPAKVDKPTKKVHCVHVL
jgi:hypothetical protein